MYNKVFFLTNDFKQIIKCDIISNKEVIYKLCPRCHNVNPDTNLTCDFCMADLPMTPEREKLIKNKAKFERKNKLRNSKDKILGMVAALFVIIAVIVVVMVLL